VAETAIEARQCVTAEMAARNQFHFTGIAALRTL
jgi:hypothetical protein